MDGIRFSGLRYSGILKEFRYPKGLPELPERGPGLRKSITGVSGVSGQLVVNAGGDFSTGGELSRLFHSRVLVAPALTVYSHVHGRSAAHSHRPN